eukprot:10423279-Alexandrium_andersonii.AAC.1
MRAGPPEPALGTGRVRRCWNGPRPAPQPDSPQPHAPRNGTFSPCRVFPMPRSSRRPAQSSRSG